VTRRSPRVLISAAIRVVAVLLASLVVVGGVFLLAYYLAPGRVNGKSLSYSLSDQAGSLATWGEGGCRRRAESRWRCFVPDSSGSGGSDYAVETDGNCWEARRLGPSGGGRAQPRAVDGCVRLRDNLRLRERGFDLLD
jgi:hypothetical protein